MNLHPQVVVDGLVRRHSAALARLHADLHEAVLESATRWADRFPDPADLNGQARCVTVRQTLLSINGGRPASPEASLRMSMGSGMSVVLRDTARNRMRVRRYPNDHLGDRPRTVLAPPPGRRETVAEQMILDEGLDAPVFAFDTATLAYELFVLWWLEADQIGLAGAELAAVVNIDDSTLVAILAAAPLPAPAPFLTPGHTESVDPIPYDDFDEFDDGASQTGDDTA
ncbi:hypothetical protein ACWEKT_29495 [Nocardia takedensis]